MDPADNKASKKPLPTRRDRWRLGALLLVLAILFASSFMSMRGSKAAKVGVSTQLYIESIEQSRSLFFTMRFLGHAGTTEQKAKLTARSLKSLRKLAEIAPTPGTIRRLAIMEYVADDPEWSATLLRLRELPITGSPFDYERELDMWRAVFTGHPDAAQVADYRDQIEKMELGWFRHPALASLYDHAGMRGAADHENTVAMRSYLIMLGLMLLAMVAGLVGGAIAIGFFVYWRWRQYHHESEAHPAIRRFYRTTPPAPLSPEKSDVLYTVFLIYLITFAVLRLIAPILLRPVMNSPALQNNQALVMYLNIGLMVTSLIVPTVALVALGRRVGLRRGDIGFRSSSLVRDVLWGVGGYMASIPLLFVSSVISSLLFRGVDTPLNPAITEFASAHSFAVQALLFSEAAIMAPLVEETMFRGVFFRSLSARAGVLGALLISSAVFAILHPQLPLGFLAIFALGSLFSFLYALRGSLVPNMVAHAINNGDIFVMLTLLLGS